MTLRNLMELYQYDMSQFEDDSENDVNEYGLLTTSTLTITGQKKGGFLLYCRVR